jgi:hypothetical protein
MRFYYPESECIDAFSFQWKTEFCYLFPPFSLISRCVQKIVREEAEILIIVPLKTSIEGLPQISINLEKKH